MLPQIRPETTLLEFFRQLLAGAPIVNGKHVTCVCTVAGGTAQVFPHGLGRVPQGAIIVSNPEAASLFAQMGALDVDNVTVELSVAADVTLKVWAY